MSIPFSEWAYADWWSVLDSLHDSVVAEVACADAILAVNAGSTSLSFQVDFNTLLVTGLGVVYDYLLTPGSPGG